MNKTATVTKTVLVTSTETLRNHLKLVSQAVPKRATHPILNHLYFYTKKDKTEITAYDLRLAITSSFLSQSTEELKFTAPAKLLSNLIQKISDEEIEIHVQPEQEEGKLSVTIKSQSGQFQLRGTDAKEFPNPPQKEKPQTLKLPCKILEEGIRKTIFACSKDEAKHVLNGINIKTSKEENILTFAATDGHRLAIAEYKLEESLKESNLTIGAKTLEEVIKLCKSQREEEIIETSYNERQISFRTKDQEINSRLINGQYPECKQLIPTSYKREFEVSKKELQDALELIEVFTDKSYLGKFSVQGGETPKLEVSSQEQDIGNAEQKLIIQGLKGNDIIVGLNTKYVLDFVKSIEQSKLKFLMNENNKPVQIYPCETNEYEKITYIIMPVTLKE
jgi:DNA polymerase-3 subunit beta